MTLVSIG